jgi:hypothetical protein
MICDFYKEIFFRVPWNNLIRNPRTGAQYGAEPALRVALPGKSLLGTTQLSRRDQQEAASFYEIEQSPVSLGMP